MGYKVPPPPPSSKGRSQQTAINKLLARFPGYRQYMPILREAAARWHIDVVFLLASLAWENEGAKAGIRNSSGARGLAQIVDKHIGNWAGWQSFQSQFAPDGRITDARAFNPSFAINYMAWRMGDHIRKYGGLNAGYSRGYNPGFTGDARGAGPAAFVPKWYFAQARGPQSPADQVGAGVDRAAAKAGNPYLQGQAFLDLWHSQINPLYEAYTGRMATRAEARQAIGNGWSDYHIRLMLSQRKSFIGSPVWKSFAPGYAAAYQAIYGDRKPDDRLISYAIVHNLGATGFQQMLRQGKGYVKSEEFAQNVSSLDGVYRQIYGSPDVNGTYVIKQATLAGWSPDQFAKYLRAQPEYQHSSEYQNNASQLASVFGGAETMTLTQATQTPAPTTGVPHDKRLGPAPWEEQPPPPEGKQLRAKPVPKRRGPPPIKAKAIDPRTMRGA